MATVQRHAYLLGSNQTTVTKRFSDEGQFQSFDISLETPDGLWDGQFRGDLKTTMNQCVALVDGLNSRDETKCHLMKHGENMIIAVYIDAPMAEQKFELCLNLKKPTVKAGLVTTGKEDEETDEIDSSVMVTSSPVSTTSGQVETAAPESESADSTATTSKPE